jgi:hypothetical protein
VRLLDRVFDLYLQTPMQRITSILLRPPEAYDSYGVAQSKQELLKAYDFLDRRLAGRAWAAGESFTLADCAAAPALFYGDMRQPIPAALATLTAYRRRLEARPSVARAIAEAQPFMHMVPRNRRRSRHDGSCGQPRRDVPGAGRPHAARDAGAPQPQSGVGQRARAAVRHVAAGDRAAPAGAGGRWRRRLGEGWARAHLPPPARGPQPGRDLDQPAPHRVGAQARPPGAYLDLTEPADEP